MKYIPSQTACYYAGCHFARLLVTRSAPFDKILARADVGSPIVTSLRLFFSSDILSIVQDIFITLIFGVKGRDLEDLL